MSPTSSPTLIHEHQLHGDATLAEAVAADVAQRLRMAIEARGRALLCVPGGKSPIALFERLRRQALPWEHVAVSLADERCVPPSHPDSNAALVRRHLLVEQAAAASFVPLFMTDTGDVDYMGDKQSAGASKVITTATTTFATPDDTATLNRWAAAAEARLHPLWPADVVVLGMGLDGHTASLFAQGPGSAAALSPDNPALCVALRPAHAPHARISLSLAALLSARHLALLVPDAGKAAIYALARRTPSRGRPISLVLDQVRHPVDVWLGA